MQVRVFYFQVSLLLGFTLRMFVFDLKNYSRILLFVSMVVIAIAKSTFLSDKTSYKTALTLKAKPSYAIVLQT